MAVKLDAFCPDGDSWTSYEERAQEFFLANDVNVERKMIAIFLSSLSPDMYEKVKALCAPAKPSELKWDEISQRMHAHYNPKPPVLAERCTFHRRCQNRGEPISDYSAELKRLASSCNFGTFLDQALRDRFIFGLAAEHVQTRLLSEDETQLTLEKAFNIAVGMETAAMNARKMRSGAANAETVTESVNKINSANSQQRGKQAHGCYRCGENTHFADKCRFRNTKCYQCGKLGHLKKMCRSAVSTGSRVKYGVTKSKAYNSQDNNRKLRHSNGDKSVYACEQSDFSDSETDVMGYVDNDDATDIGHVDSGSNLRAPIWVTVCIEGKSVEMELDTGAAFSIMSTDMFKQFFGHVPLKRCEKKLRTYTGQRILPKGIAKVKVQYNDQKCTAELYVVDSDGPPLFGRSWMELIKLDWETIFAHLHGDCSGSVVHVVSDAEQTSVQLKCILDRYKDVFSSASGAMRDVTATLSVKDCSPKFLKARPVPYALLDKVSTELDRLETSGVVTKVEHSNWATPIVPVVKGDGSVRICGDFKSTLNPVLDVDRYPIPKIEDLFSKLSHGVKFSKLDLAHAYQQIEVAENSREFLTINTHRGLYRYNRLPFGISSAPSIFQRQMDRLFARLPGIQCYQDDILITGRNDQEHLRNLERVLQILEENGLKVKESKCDFFKSSIHYLGHVIDGQGLHTSKEKVRAVVDAPRPHDVSTLRSYIGLLNYYGRFLPDLATILHPLYDLLKHKQEWKWTTSCEQAFLKTKEMIASSQVMTHYDLSRPLYLACDASSYGIAAVISHVMDDGGERPIAFASRVLSSSERNYAQIEKEALSIIFGIKKFHQYLYGRHFTLVTDHKPLVSIFGPKTGIPSVAAARMQRWAILLAAHDYEIKFKGTAEHCNADGLSRLPLQDAVTERIDDAGVFNLSQLDRLPVTADDIRRATAKDKTLSQVLRYTEEGWPTVQETPALEPFRAKRNELILQSGCLMWGIRVVIPAVLRDRVLEVLHESHLGVVRMKTLARGYVWWFNIDRDIEQLVRSCTQCQSFGNSPPPIVLHPWAFPEKPWQRLHIDFAGPFHNCYFFVIVDAYSKWPEVIMMKTTTASRTIEVLRDIFARYGLPAQIVSDNGPQFTSAEFSDFLRTNNIKHTRSAPYHPATNGLAERFIQTMKRSLRRSSHERSLRHCLSNFLLTYRTTQHATTHETPARLFLAFHPRTRLDFLRPNMRQTVLTRSVPPKGREREFEAGQRVMTRSYGGDVPWVQGTVLKRTGPVSYQIQINSDRVWHRHADQIKSTSVGSSVESSHKATDSLVMFPNTPSHPTPQQVVVAPVATPKPVQQKTSNAPTKHRYPARQRKAPNRLTL